MTLISTYMFGIYVSYLLDNCALIRNKVCTKKVRLVSVLFLIFFCMWWVPCMYNYHLCVCAPYHYL